jgi:N-acetylglucosaminyldiphosphoundecaprenol N-acetyl-beta-D-mannosaminyltransferase
MQQGLTKLPARTGRLRQAATPAQPGDQQKNERDAAHPQGRGRAAKGESLPMSATESIATRVAGDSRATSKAPAATMPARHRRMPARFLDVPLHPYTMEETVAEVAAAMRERRPLQHVALNVAKLVNLRKDAELRADVFGADIVGIDGMGIVVGARLFGIAVPERVAGVDLMMRILRLCADQGFRPYLLGAKPEVLAAAMAELGRLHPDLQIAGSQHGYFSAAEEAGVVAAIRDSGADCLFVAMPTPRKERFMAAHRAALGVPFVMGVGGSIDVLAGHVRRAPAAWQNAGFEWLYRTLQEPRRMWRRYLTTNAAYAGLLAAALLNRAIGRQPH